MKGCSKPISIEFENNSLKKENSFVYRNSETWQWQIIFFSAQRYSPVLFHDVVLELRGVMPFGSCCFEC